MLYNKKPLVQSVVEPTDTNVYWVQVTPNSTDVPIIKIFHNGAWIPLTGTPASIQDLLDLKAPLHNPTFTGDATLNGEPISTNNLNGTNYLIVYGTGTPEENAVEFLAAYNEAKKMPRYIGSIDTKINTQIQLYKGQTLYDTAASDYGIADADYIGTSLDYSYSSITEGKAKSVRTTVIVAPGEYNFGAAAFTVDAPGINIISLTGNSDVIIRSTENYSTYNTIYGIKVTANDILIKGINCKTNTFYIASNLNNIICEYCTGGDYSFVRNGTASGTFNYCIGGNYSFGTNGTASGTFNNCTGGDASFGSGGGTASGTFNYCTGGINSFASGGTASGIFNYCVGGAASFANEGVASGTFNYCIGGNYSFGSMASGIFNYCVGGTFSFGIEVIVTSARLYYTRLTSGTFRTPITGGRLILCIDGNNNIVTI